MDLSKPRTHSDLILYIWKIIDLPKILKDELAFHISFVLYLMNYDKAKKLIKTSLEKNLLIEHDGYLGLSSELEKKLEWWQKKRKTEIYS
ncbi:MAG: DUF2240 family protein, partial [Candidatus Lokiarchaeota archaeon]|nr:DUF2240 family protein [Candidatus Lokiarchaeota archaeon]MBD3342911.1 DUF2240 family protein [Candidatus Lokiarchaeota archaeon]